MLNWSLSQFMLLLLLLFLIEKKKKSYLLACWEQVWLVFKGSENPLTKELLSTFAQGQYGIRLLCKGSYQRQNQGNKVTYDFSQHLWSILPNAKHRRDKLISHPGNTGVTKMYKAGCKQNNYEKLIRQSKSNSARQGQIIPKLQRTWSNKVNSRWLTLRA